MVQKVRIIVLNNKQKHNTFIIFLLKCWQHFEMIFMFWYKGKFPYMPVHEKTNKIMCVLSNDTVLDQAQRL